MQIRVRAIQFAALLLAAGAHCAASAETLLATVSRAHTSSHHLCDYDAASVCAFQSHGLVWKLVSQDGNIYIFNHPPKRHSLRFMGAKSVNALRSGQTFAIDANSYTIRMTPMWAVHQLL